METATIEIGKCVISAAGFLNIHQSDTDSDMLVLSGFSRSASHHFALREVFCRRQKGNPDKSASQNYEIVLHSSTVMLNRTI